MKYVISGSIVHVKKSLRTHTSYSIAVDVMKPNIENNFGPEEKTEHVGGGF